MKLYRDGLFIRQFNNRVDAEVFVLMTDPFYDHDWTFV